MDIVIALDRADRTLNFGVFTGEYEYMPEAPVHPHRRKVTGLKTGVSRGLFPQEALNGIGSAMTLVGRPDTLNSTESAQRAVDRVLEDKKMPSRHHA